MSFLLKTIGKKILSQKTIFYNQESYQEGLKFKLDQKQRQYEAAENWGGTGIKRV